MKGKTILLTIVLSMSAAITSVAADLGSGKEGFSDNSFLNPPSEARPRVWWHWMNGNISADGIRKDLLWMQRAGLGGFTVFDAGMATPQVVSHCLAYMSPEWQQALTTAVSLADSLGFEVTIPSSPGWSFTGGPWVTPEDAMKKLTWREMTVRGNGKVQRITLPQPYETTGIFQNSPFEPNVLLGETVPENLPHLYHDTRILAIPVSSHEQSLVSLGAKVYVAGQEVDCASLCDGDILSGVKVPFGDDGKAVIDIVLPQSVEFRSLRFCDGRMRSEYDGVPAECPCELLVSTDSTSLISKLSSLSSPSFRSVMRIPSGGAPIQTLDIPATKGNRFRVVLDKPQVNYYYIMMGMATEPKDITVGELNLFTTSLVNHSEEKTGFMATIDVDDFPTPDSPISASTSRKGGEMQYPATSQVVDLTSLAQPDGTLSWKAPKGQWRIIRFGYSLIGTRNHPASPEATGLEVDKLDKAASHRYFHHYLNLYRHATSKLSSLSSNLSPLTSIDYLLTDSYEAGSATWTPSVMEEFKQRRGYDMTPWMPVLSGYIIGSPAESDRFLWDWRKTLSELMAEGYDQLTEICKEQGLKGRYSESHENGRLYIVDGMDVKRNAAIPMSAIWANGNMDNRMAAADIRESASVAHIYGQNIVAAESFTCVGYPNNAWRMGPADLLPYAHQEFANGLNRIVVHTSPHQPVDSLRPGLSLSATGQWFDRHEIWAEQARPFVDYLARTSYMLQQGHFVADVAYYYGEDTNICALFGHRPSPVPDGYNFDYVNPDALLNQLHAEDGRLVTASGMSYRVLALDPHARMMSLPVLRKIVQLASQGVVICGDEPQQMASLADDSLEYRQLVDKTWHGNLTNVISGHSLLQVLQQQNIAPDATFMTNGTLPLRYVHRTTDEVEIYWIDNPDSLSLHVEVSLRTVGRVPQCYDPTTGKVLPVAYRIADGRTTVSFDLPSYGATFIVLGDKATVNEMTLPQVENKPISVVFSPWDVTFPAGLGAPEHICLDTLMSLSSHSDSGVRYFSGTATYTTTFKLAKKDLKSHSQFLLNLGSVADIAEVKVNGKALGTLWKEPYVTEITSALRSGANTLEVRVTNLWANRLIGDVQPGVTDKVTYTSMPYYTPEATLLPSGLIGPVCISAPTPLFGK